jgi:hypothetical protein
MKYQKYSITGPYFYPCFGLSIGNLDELKHYRWTQQFRLDLLNKEVIKFRELIIEATFLVRALFFLLFGYLIKTAEIINADTLVWAIGLWQFFSFTFYSA